MKFSSSFALAIEANGDMSTWLVCFLGISVVFVGLVCIIALLYLMNYLIGKGECKKAQESDASASSAAPIQNEAAAPIENRRELIAAVCAAVAEEEGTDISAIRVISFKKV